MPATRPARRLGTVTALAAVILLIGVTGPADADKPGHRVVTTPDAPAAIGPYSQAIAAGQTLYVSGQLPLDPRTGAMDGADITTQTRRSLTNIDAILEANNMTRSNVVSTTVFLADLDDFAAFNAAYAEYFGTTAAPARATVQAARIPRDARVEIAAIAVR